MKFNQVRKKVREVITLIILFVFVKSLFNFFIMAGLLLEFESKGLNCLINNRIFNNDDESLVRK